jgi:hypothetical protein
VDVLAQRLGMAVVRDEAAGLWAIGPETLTGRTLLDARAPNLTLPDWRGGEYSLSSSRGRKVIMVAWASW